MHISTSLIAVFLLGLGLGLDHNETSSTMHFWNTTTAQLATTSSTLSKNGPLIQEMATIQLQIGNLTGSGVIELGYISTASETSRLSDLLNSTFSNHQSYETEAPASRTTFCPPNTTAAFPYQGTSTRNFNATVRGPITQPSRGPIPLTSQVFTGVSSPTNARLPKITATLLALMIQTAVMSLL